jgi:hypothetical protein
VTMSVRDTPGDGDRGYAAQPLLSCRRTLAWTLAIALAALLVTARFASAQGEAIAVDAPAIAWSDPENVSQSPTSSGHPTIVISKDDSVHLFWSEDVNGPPLHSGEPPAMGNAIAYSRWDGNRWTEPVDVLSVPTEAIAGFPEAALDAEDNLHLVWIGQRTVYHSKAPAEQAASAHAWSTPVAVARGDLPRTHPVDVAIDSASVVHLLMSDNSYGGSARVTRSFDGGVSWQPLQEISAPPGPLEASFSRVRLMVDAMDRLHATWQSDQAEGYGQGVYYARSTDGGLQWEPPQRFGYRDAGETFVEFPILVSRTDREMHAFYIDGSSIGRWHRISLDGGESWSAAEHIITSMEGINGYMAPVMDGRGRLHLIINMRTRSHQVVGIYHAIWLGDNWSAVRPVDVSSPAAPSAHVASAAVRLGNEIHVVYVHLGGGEIWHVCGTISDIEPQTTMAATTLDSGPLPTANAPPTPPPTLVPRTPVKLDLQSADERGGWQGAWTAGIAAVVAMVVGVSWYRASSA